MNAVVSPNPLELILLLLFGGPFGMPQGVPPTPEDPLMAKAAPADCLLYATWSGTTVPGPASKNHTEQLLAEPEIQKFLIQARGRTFDFFRVLAARHPDAQAALADAAGFLQLIADKPGAVFVNQISFDHGALQDIQGGALFRLDEKADAVEALLKKAQSKATKESIAVIQIDSRSFTRFQGDKESPPITWGIDEGYLLVGFGHESMEGLLQRIRGEAPEWLTAVRAKLAVPRFSSLVYVNVKSLLDLAVEQADEPKVATLVAALGLDKIQYFASVAGLDAESCLSRSLLAVQGRGTGLLAWIDSTPLRAPDLKAVPRDAPLTIALKFDPTWLFDLWLEVVQQVEPMASDDIRRELEQVNAHLEIDPREDLLKSLGNTWKFFAQPGPNGSVAGWSFAVEVRDRERLARVDQVLLAKLREALPQAAPATPSLTTDSVDGHNVHTLSFAQMGVPLAPSWCLTDDQLFITPVPQAMGPLLADAGDPGFAERSEVVPLISNDAATLAMLHADTRQVVSALLPLVPALQQMIGMRMPADVSSLPPSEVITRHLQPTVVSVSRTPDGLVLALRQTLPGPTPGACAPVAAAILLPALSSSREAARRSQSMNNLKQIALAMHNFHDTYKAFPAGYSADADGKPLLSWRVHILPFIEQAELYDQFHLNEPWDSPHNKTLIEKMPATYRAPGSRSPPGTTNYLGVGGADGVFVRPRGGEGADRLLGTGMAHITDGTSNTIMTVEAPDELAIIWTRPGDFSPNKQNPVQGLVGLRQNIFLAGLTDGSVRVMSQTIDPKTLRALFTKSGGELVNLP